MRCRTNYWLAPSALTLILLAASCSTSTTTVSSSAPEVESRPEELPLSDGSTAALEQQAEPPTTTTTVAPRRILDETANDPSEPRLRSLFDETLTPEQWACVDTTDTPFDDASVAEAVAILDCAPEAATELMVDRYAQRFGLDQPLADFACLAERVDADGYRRAAAGHLLAFEGHMELPADFASSFASGHASCMPGLLMGELVESPRVLFVGHKSEIAATSLSLATDGECVRSLSESSRFARAWDEITNQLVSFTEEGYFSYSDQVDLRPLLFDCVAIGTLLEVQARSENMEVPDVLVQCLNDTVTGRMFLAAVENSRLDPNDSDSLLNDCVDSINTGE